MSASRVSRDLDTHRPDDRLTFVRLADLELVEVTFTPGANYYSGGSIIPAGTVGPVGYRGGSITPDPEEWLWSSEALIEVKRRTLDRQRRDDQVEQKYAVLTVADDLKPLGGVDIAKRAPIHRTTRARPRGAGRPRRRARSTRAGARAGPSDEPGPGEPPGPSSGPPARRQVVVDSHYVVVGIEAA